MKFFAALSLAAAVSAQTSSSMGSMANMDASMTNHTTMGAAHASMNSAASNSMAGMPMVKRHGPNDDGDNSTMAGMAGMPMVKRHGPNDDGDNSTMAGMAGMPMVKRHGPNDDGDNSTMAGMAGMPMLKRHGPNDDGDNSTMAGMAGMPMAKRHGPNDDGDNSTMAGMAGMPMKRQTASTAMTMDSMHANGTTMAQHEKMPGHADMMTGMNMGMKKRHGPNDDGDNSTMAGMAGMPMKRQTTSTAMTMDSMHANGTTMAQHEKMPGHADMMTGMNMGMKKRHGPVDDEKPNGTPTMKACSTSSVMAGSMMDPKMVMAPGSTMPMRMSAKFRRALVARGILC